MEGDEYLDTNMVWKPVPKNDFGLQIMFTKYAEVRRPSETTTKTISGEAHTGKTAEKQVPGVLPPPPPQPPKPLTPPKPLADTFGKAKAKVLPTVVSTKAHTKPERRPHIKMPEAIVLAVAAFDPTVVKPLPSVVAACAPSIAIDIKEPGNIWIGRNGTFNMTGLGLNMTNKGESVQIKPIGKRGLAKNALIEFPASIIPQVIDWLLRHQKPPTPTPTS